MNFFQGEGDSRVHSNFFLGGRGEGVSPETRVQSPESTVQGPGFTTASYAVPTVIVATGMPKSCEKIAKNPKSGYLNFKSCYRTFCIFLFSIY